MIMKLVAAGSGDLTTPCEDFDFNGPQDAKNLAETLIETMEYHKGIGLAANQVGLPWRVFVTAGDPYAVFNPKLIDTSDEQIVLEEGCLTYPGLYVKIKRPKHIRVRFTDLNGETKTEKYTGMTARIFLHEMEHLDGGTFYNNATKFHKDQAFRRWKTYLRHPERFTTKS